MNAKKRQVMYRKVNDGSQINHCASFIVDLNKSVGQESALTELIELPGNFSLLPRRSARKRQLSLQQDGDGQRHWW